MTDNRLEINFKSTAQRERFVAGTAARTCDESESNKENPMNRLEKTTVDDKRMRHGKCIEATVSTVLRSLVRWLIGQGVPARALMDWVKQSYVDVATERGTVPNTEAEIATGLCRKEIARLRRKDRHAQPDPVTMNLRRQSRITKVLTAWHVEPYYLDANGHPVVLPLQNGTPNLVGLIERFCGDLSYGKVICAMEKAGSIQCLENGRYMALRRQYAPSPASEEQLLRYGSVINDVIRTITHPFVHPSSPRRLETRITDTIPRQAIPEFRAFIDARSTEFANDVDGWLARCAARPNMAHTAEKPERRVRIGLGFYWIQDDND